jgi:hypothetical protein
MACRLINEVGAHYLLGAWCGGTGYTPRAGPAEDLSMMRPITRSMAARPECANDVMRSSGVVPRPPKASLIPTRAIADKCSSITLANPYVRQVLLLGAVGRRRDGPSLKT